jgi:hypothetical protein
MRVGVIRTTASPCRCGEAVSKGLKALGHEPLLTDSEEIELRVSELAHECDLVIDHTDTFRGRGLYRFVVRRLLEARGVRVVGSDSNACFLADDKVAAKTRLSGAGIPTPPGIVVTSKTWRLPSWLKPPLVLKPAFEHMSRGVRLVKTDQEVYGVAAHLLESLEQPILVESYIPGRELAVSLLDGPMGLQVLPPLEWRFGTTDPDFLTERSKLIEPEGERRDVLRADLPDDLHSEMEAMAQHAFHVRGLRDYARFDLRLSSGGTLFFLEANTTPSLEPLEAIAAGRPVLASDIPGNRLPVLGENGGPPAGTLFDPHDQDDFIRHAIKLIDDERTRNAFGQAGRLRASQWPTPETEADGLIAAYMTALGES